MHPLPPFFSEYLRANEEFREIADFFNQVHYFHIVPQLLKHPGLFFNSGVTKDEDFFGFHFLKKIIETPQKTRDSRLKKIEKALQIAVPQLKELTISRDDRGVPHLEGLYEHWRYRGARQREDQFSDGTLRLIGFLWSLLETNSMLLLEEPELSLNSSIVSKIPAMIYNITKNKKKKQQVIISSHSPDLLSDEGIGGEEVLLMIPSREGTKIEVASADQEIRLLLEGGLSAAEAIIPYRRFCEGRRVIMHGIRILRHIKGNLETGLRRSLNKFTHPPTRHQTFLKVWPPAGPPEASLLFVAFH